MSKQPITEQLKLRSQTSFKTMIHTNAPINELQAILLSSPTDEGVVRNGGRRGSSFGPDAILNILKKFPLDPDKKLVVGERTVSFKQEELTNFDDAQISESYELGKGINGFLGNTVIHLGGGHDHIYPLLRALEKKYMKMVIINVDPHLDTRIDEWNHSGTPFRRFSSDTTLKSFRLFQLGAHTYSNPRENFNALEKGEMTVIPFKRLQKETNNFSNTPRELFENEIKIEEDELIVLSLDADAIEASTMEAVSAVNPMGIPTTFIESLFLYIRSLKNHNPKIYGIYEYNPLYDNLSAKGARFLAGLLYNTIV